MFSLLRSATFSVIGFDGNKISKSVFLADTTANGTPAAAPIGASVRLHGTLESGWRLDGFPLNVGPGTRIDKAPSPGDYVEVRGRLDEGPTVTVERLRRR